MPDDQLTSKFHPQLESMLAQLEAEREATAAGRAPVELDQQSVGRLSRVDAMQQQQMALATDRQREVQITRIHNALARIDAGEFGACVECGNDIPEKRLEVDPSVPLCVACAEAKGGLSPLRRLPGRRSPAAPGGIRNASCRSAAICRPR
jgi:DnaK suppressor protein